MRACRDRGGHQRGGLPAAARAVDCEGGVGQAERRWLAGHPLLDYSWEICLKASLILAFGLAVAEWVRQIVPSFEADLLT